MRRLLGMGLFAARYLEIRAWCSSSIHCDGVKGPLILAIAPCMLVFKLTELNPG
jgi:hypothetical protein